MRTEQAADWLLRAIDALSDPRRRSIARHPLGGWVVSGKQRLRQFDPTFLEDDESSESPVRRAVSLDEHSRGVADLAGRFAAGCGLDADLYATAGSFHDLGKLDPRFQALLKGRSPRTAGGEPLAKSGNFGTGDREVHRYPTGARHELLSTALVASRTTDDLFLHLIATHHGSARPFAGSVEENADAKSPFTATLFGETFSIPTCAQTPAVWNTELANRFWRVVRRFGWWGTAFREAVFRLADHAQSRAEQEDSQPRITSSSVLPLPNANSSVPVLHPIELTGLDGSNPLALLAALGTLRLADQAFAGTARLSWIRKECWTPVLHVPSAQTLDQLVEQLHCRMHRVGDPLAANEAKTLDESYRRQKKQVEQARTAIKRRKLRGKERELAVAQEVVPLQVQADAARAAWLAALQRSVPAPFLALGKALSATAEEFREFAVNTVKCVQATKTRRRADDGFVSALGCEVCIAETGKIVPTEFQLITGSGRQFFLETIGLLMAAVEPSQIRRALIGPWTFPDQRLSFRWDPQDDRRYAQRWADPSDDVIAGEHGVNLLAAFALPLFSVIPTARGPVTTGFRQRDGELRWAWPLWTKPQSYDSVRSLLAFAELTEAEPPWKNLRAAGIEAAFFVRKIQVGSGLNSKLNFTASSHV